MAKKYFGKNLLRLSSMLIAVLMLVTTMFTGIASAEQAEDFGIGNTITITSYAWVQCGQNVVLEAGKTYLYSYYYSGPLSVGGVMYYGDGTDGTPIEPIHTAYDQDYSKVTYKFVAPETATPAGEEGKVKIYLGFQIPSTDTYHIYYPNVYAVDDATKTNLFYDYLIEGIYALKAPEGGISNWYKPYGTVIGYRATRPNLDSLGGLDLFKKTDADRHVLKLEAGVSGMPYFGQRVSLEPGKTYVYSNCYLPGTEPYLQVCYPDMTELSSQVIYDNDWWRQGLKFTVPADAPVEEDGKALIFVGFRGHNSSAPLYYYDFKLYDVELPEFNLLNDNVLEGGDFEVKADTWKTPGGNYVNSNYSEVTLESIGGIDTFKKTDADRHVLKLTPETSGQPYIGQRVSLTPGKTYVYSNYHLSGIPANQQVCFPDLTPIDTEIISDNTYSKQGVKFTVPADATVDENGKVLIFVGFRGNYSSDPIYYYDLRLYDVNNPELNLLKDAALLGAGFEVKADTWKTPGDNYVNPNGVTNYSEVTLESIGGISAFLPFKVKCDLTLDDIVDIRDLVRMKKFSVGSIDTLPDGIGNLNCDTEIAGAADLILLRKELLK